MWVAGLLRLGRLGRLLQCGLDQGVGQVPIYMAES